MCGVSLFLLSSTLVLVEVSLVWLDYPLVWLGYPPFCWDNPKFGWGTLCMVRVSAVWWRYSKIGLGTIGLVGLPSYRNCCKKLFRKKNLVPKIHKLLDQNVTCAQKLLEAAIGVHVGTAWCFLQYTTTHFVVKSQ